MDIKNSMVNIENVNIPCISNIFQPKKRIRLTAQQKKELEKWGLTKIYCARADKNHDADPKLLTNKQYLDGVIFGLSGFRTRHKKDIIKCLENGTTIRWLTMNPDPDKGFINYRDESGKTHEQIKMDIEGLVKWANDINESNKTRNVSGKIYIKGYTCMTLDFYWRLDHELYIGPYWYNQDSQQTITYRFEEGGKGFTIYSEYFEELWNNKDNVILCNPGV